MAEVTVGVTLRAERGDAKFCLADRWPELDGLVGVKLPLFWLEETAPSGGASVGMVPK